MKYVRVNCVYLRLQSSDGHVPRSVHWPFQNRSTTERLLKSSLVAFHVKKNLPVVDKYPFVYVLT